MPYSQEYLDKLLFAHLHTHSEYSNIRILDSINKIKDMILYVASIGQNALALSDHESLSGHVDFIKTVKTLKEKNKIPQDFKLILGNEIYLVDEEQMNMEVESGISNFYHFLLLAKDAKGHEQLRKLSSRAWSRMFSYKGIDRVPTFYSDLEEVIGEDKGHLIASSACLGGYIPKNVQKILSEDYLDKQEYKRNIHNLVNWCINIFGKDDFYIELQPSDMIEQVEFNKYALIIAEAYKLKHIITTDAHYLKKEDREIHKAYLTSDEDDGGNREVDDFYSSTHFFTVNELLLSMNYLDLKDVVEGINNTVEIANKIEIYDLANKQVIPKVKLPNKEQWYFNKDINNICKNYEWINKMIMSNEVYDNYLISLIQEGISNRIKEEDYNETFERIDIECKEILETSRIKEEPISSYFVTMIKNINIIWEDANAIVAPGRGSAGGFIIDYLVGITQINPLKQGVEMPHWRFICSERPDYPDIDIDVPSHKRDIVFKCLSNYYQSIGGIIVRVCTFGTETAKSTILTACRGLKINNDIALYLSSLIPVERGKVWSIEDCYYGNEEKNRNPITEFKNLVDEHEGLLSVAIGIQGLINKRSSHPCGILIVNDDFTKYNALMRTPSGELVSQFGLEDSEYVGNIKYDLLNTKTCAMIQVTLEMLVEYGEIEWQGTLRKTYDKYLHPDIIDKETPEIWDLLNRGELISAFQFDSPVGEQALKAIKPVNLLEATNANNLMRLMVEDGAEQPLEMYVRYKQDINQWYQDMKQFGLKPNEIEIMKKHLSQDYGVCSTQEGMMMISMDKNIAGFDVVESNILRKGVAKKIGDVYEKAHKLLYEKGQANNASKRLLDYVWDIQIAMQKGYGFSLIHGIEYTYILIQQLNLVYYYPSIFWNTGVLLVESGALEQDAIINESEDEDDVEEELLQRKEKTTNYGTIAKAIGNMQHHNVSIVLPNINKADLRFKPDIENNEIIFGFKGIMKINNEISKLIMENRPFVNLEDFYQRMVLVKREVITKTGKVQNKSLVSTTQTIMLIKAGAFDTIEQQSREVILEGFLRKINPYKQSVNSKTIEKVIQRGIVPLEFKN
jgi:DNA polymerase-3 subunit alpha